MNDFDKYSHIKIKTICPTCGFENLIPYKWGVRAVCCEGEDGGCNSHFAVSMSDSQIQESGETIQKFQAFVYALTAPTEKPVWNKEGFQSREEQFI